MTKRNTFVFNFEWYAILSDYPAEVRLEVYEAIIGYASSGTLSDLKPLAKMAFSFIRKEMDYNRDRYEQIVKQRREAGKRSAESKAQQKQQKSTNSTSVDFVQRKSTKGNYNDNVNDNVNDNELSSTTTRMRAGDAVAAEGGLIENFFKDQDAIEAFCRGHCIPHEKLRQLCEAVVTEWRLTGQTHVTEQDARRHLLSQVRIKLNHGDDTQTQDRHAKRRGADSAAVRPEDYTGEI